MSQVELYELAVKALVDHEAATFTPKNDESADDVVMDAADLKTRGIPATPVKLEHPATGVVQYSIIVGRTDEAMAAYLSYVRTKVAEMPGATLTLLGN